MSEPFIGEVRLFGFNFAPQGWAMCNGQILSINQNTALFSLLGTQYGGNGQTTFALPDLRGRDPKHQGTGPGLSNYSIGQVGGTESEALGVLQMPAHTHAVQASTGDPTTSQPGGKLLAAVGEGAYAAPPGDTTMAATMIASAGGGQPHNNLPPYLVMNWCIALQGIYPSRN
jgi:microcystin-dependent protein